MLSQNLSLAVLIGTIILWPIFMSKIAWDTALCEQGCIFLTILHTFIFAAPIFWSLVALYIITHYQLIIITERRQNRSNNNYNRPAEFNNNLNRN